MVLRWSPTRGAEFADALLALKRVPEATAAYRKGLARLEQLTNYDRSNAEWQTDLVVGLYKLALPFRLR